MAVKPEVCRCRVGVCRPGFDECAGCKWRRIRQHAAANVNLDAADSRFLLAEYDQICNDIQTGQYS